jgi:hypothetical protein
MTSPRHDSIAFRDELLSRNWPDDGRVGALAGIQGSGNANQYVRALRADGRILGVWSEDQHAFLYPEFQFDHGGGIRSGIARLLAVLPGNDDREGWRRVFWLYSSHAQLDGETPAEVFPAQPARVVEVAEREFNGSPDDAW